MRSRRALVPRAVLTWALLQPPALPNGAADSGTGIITQARCISVDRLKQLLAPKPPPDQ